MELDDLKEAWQKYKREHPSEMTPKMMAADTRQKATELDRQFTRDINRRIFGGFLAMVVLLSMYDRGRPLYANIGLIIMVLSSAMMLTGTIIQKLRLRVSHPERPADAYLLEQKNKILARIGLIRFYIRCLVPTAAFGLVLCILPIHSINAKLIILIMLVLTLILGYWLIIRKIRNELLTVTEIDQEIAAFENRRVLPDTETMEEGDF